ncbi:MAG: helix-turn-helix domain-containing protein [Chthoniobacteraceae bacterium]
MKTENDLTVLARISRSQLYRDYALAFEEATGLPLTLTPAEDWHLAHQGRRKENPFCMLLARQNKACAACLQTQYELAAAAKDRAGTVTCFAGLNETAVPLRLGEQLVGYLRTGEVLVNPPTARDYSRVAQKLQSMGICVEGDEFREAYFKTRVFTHRQYESVVHLLKVFAQHLMMTLNQVLVQIEHAEPAGITRARSFIDLHYGEDLSLARVAQIAGMCTFYFCKQFKKATGCSYTEYLNRIRIERAREELLKPQARVSEVAYEVGFQSLTHFNRIFKKLTGESPSSYRTHLPLARAA